MGKSFFNYSKEKVSEPSDEIKEKIRQNIPNEQRESIENTVNKFSNMSQGELMQNLFSEVNKQKQNGTFDAKKLEQAVDSIGGYLSPEQKRNIKELINQFK